jgi:membrane-associated protease RseP (regulator of RpoE activity)
MIPRHITVAVLLAFVAGSAQGQYTPEPPSTPRAPQAPMPAAPRTPVPGRPAAAPLPPTPGAVAMPPVPPTPAPEGWFGFSIRCDECGWTRSGNETTPRWESTTPPQIGIVALGGPAEVAGLRTGDRITHIDGSSILSPQGARRFGAVRPGQRIRLTVTRNGTSLTRELTLSERPRSMSGRSSLRYSGRWRGVDVDVWSPVGATVQRDGDTMTINVGGSTIRLKATRTTPPPGD